MNFSSKVRSCFWFDKKGEEAAAWYTALLPDSRIENVVRPDPDGSALVVEFTLCGAPMMILNGGPHYQVNEAASISVLTENQAETDSLWAKLTGDGGSEGRCGWVRDRFGLSWQIVPEALPRMLASDDHAAAARVREAMMAMTKLDIAALEAAYRAT